MICQIKNFFCPLGILWYKFLSYIEVLHVLSELIELPEVFSSMKKCLFRGALRPRDPLIKLLELRFVSSSSETSRSSGTIQTSQSSISSHPAFPDVNYMHCSTLSMMFTQEGLLKTAVPKHLSHYTFKCVRIHMRLPIVATMTNKSSATLTYKIIYQCALCMRITGRERGSR